MEWNKAKNYVIIVLIIINCVFCVLNIIKHGKTRLDSESISDTKTVLASKGVTLNCDLPKDFSPMGQLYMKDYEYDYIELQEIFFGTISGVIRTQEGSDIVFSKDESVLRVSGNEVSFEDGGAGVFGTVEDAASAVNKYVKGLNDEFADYSLRMNGDTDSGWYFEYRQRFHGQSVFSNFLKAKVDRNGKMSIKFNWQQPVEYRGSKESIISPAEAVYCASDLIKLEKGNSTVDRVERGYYLTERHGEGRLAAVPWYKIYVNGGSSAYYVNAYSGDVTED